MSELRDSFIEVLKKRTTSIAFGTYIFFWAAFHWQGIYSTLFVSGDSIHEKYGLLKNEYVNQNFFGYHGPVDWVFLAGYIIPLVLTVLFIWPFPKFVLIHAYRIEQEHKTERMRAKFVEEKKRQAFVIQNIQQASRKVEAETKLSTEKSKAREVDPSILWDDEYIEFEKHPSFKSFSYILESIYEHSGLTKVFGNYNEVVFEVPGGALKLADTNDLVKIDTNKDKIQLTEKGKRFARNYPHYAGH